MLILSKKDIYIHVLIQNSIYSYAVYYLCSYSYFHVLIHTIFVLARSLCVFKLQALKLVPWRIYPEENIPWRIYPGKYTVEIIPWRLYRGQYTLENILTNENENELWNSHQKMHSSLQIYLFSSQSIIITSVLNFKLYIYFPKILI